MVQILVILPVIVAVLVALLQLRLASLGGLSPIKFELPDLPTLEADDRLANVHVEIIGENDLLYPEAIVALGDGHTAFVSLGDGRIVRLTKGQGSDGIKSWKDVVWQTVLRTGGPRILGKTKRGEITLDDWKCGKGGPADSNNMEAKCGRPLGLWLTDRASVDPSHGVNMTISELREDQHEDVLLVADAYKGFLMITNIDGVDNEGVNSPETHTLATRADTDPPDYKFTLLNSVVQTRNGDVYLTETSQKFQRRRIFYAAMDGTPTGRLLRYRSDEEGSTVEVMAENIFIANGISVSHDEKSLLIVSGVQILRFDLSSERIDPVPFVEVMPGTGDNIKAMDQLPNGKKMKCYWAGLGGKYVVPFSLLKFLSDKPWLRSILLALVPYRRVIDLIPKWTALAVYGEQGKLVETLRDDGNLMDESGKKTGVTAPWISEVEPVGEYLFLLSWYNPFLARVKRSSIIKQG